MSGSSISASAGGSVTRIVILLVLIFSLWLTYRIIQRLKGGNRNEKAGCFSSGYVFLVVLCLSSLTASGVSMMVSTVHDYFSLPKYSATVIDNQSYRSKDSEGRYRTMYQPKVAFTDESGRRVEIDSNISSSEPKAVGSTLEVGYRSDMDSAKELSLRTLLLMCGLSVLLSIMGYVLALVLCYALGWRTDGLLQTGRMALFYLLLPAGMIFLFGGICYGLGQYFWGDRPDMPGVMVGVLIFFALVLLLAILGYMRMVFWPDGNEE